MIKLPYRQSLFALIIFLSSSSFISAGTLPQTDFPESFITSSSAKNGIKSSWYDDATTR